MSRLSFPLPWRGRCGVVPPRAFTLIEMLVVMVIILILAGLILSVAGNASYKASFSRAQSEIQQMTTAMENYRVDNGTYPRDSTGNTTDTLNAQGNPPGNPPDPSTYALVSKFLFKELSGFNNTAANPKRAYVTFLPSQLTTGSGTQTVDTYIIDPFGLSYGYSTAYQAAQDTAASGGTANDGTYGYNPTFDLWSTGGYGTGGKSYPAGVTAAQYYTLWAKNW